jgi:hypothetical protein
MAETILARTGIGTWTFTIQTFSMPALPWPEDAAPVPGCPRFAPDHNYAVQISW